MKPTDFSKYLTDYFTKYLFHEIGASCNTIQSYKDTFVLLLKFLNLSYKYKAEIVELKHLTKDIVVEFLDWLQHERKCGTSTRNQRLTAIHSFIRYVQYQNPINMFEFQRILSIKPKKTAKKSINYLSVDGIKLILQQPATGSLKGRRDLTLLALMYDTAARVQEIIDLTPGAIRFDKFSTIQISGKGRKTRVVPLLNNDVDILKRYITERGLEQPQCLAKPLFSNSRGEKFSRPGITNILKRYADKARKQSESLIPENLSCHSLRHSKAMHLLQAGVNLVYIRDFLGHTSVTTTEIYARADSKQKRDAIEKAHINLVPPEEPQWLYNDNLLGWLKSL